MKLLTVIMSIIAGSFSFYQREMPVDYAYANKKVSFKAIIKALNKDNRYAVQLPGNLSWYHTTEQITADIWNPFTSFIDIPARINQANYDYKFIVIANGMSDLRAQLPRYIRTELPDYNNIPREVKGFVRDFTCHFPCTLQVTDASGALVKTIEIAGKDELFTVTMHKDLLLADNRPEYPKAENPYFSEKEMMDAETVYHDVLAKKAEQLVAYKVFQKVSLAISFLFKDYNSGKQLYGWGFVKDRNNDFATIDESVASFKKALDSLDRGSLQGCSIICESLRRNYADILQSTGAGADRVKEILYYNLAHVNLLSGHYTEARNYYELFIKSGVAVSSRIALELKARIDLFEFHDKVKSAT